MSKASDPKVCRLCQDSHPVADLIQPCCCKGSLQFVHRTCLDQWRSSGVNPVSVYQCEICKLYYQYERRSMRIWLLSIFLHMSYFILIMLLMWVVFFFSGKLVLSVDVPSHKTKITSWNSFLRLFYSYPDEEPYSPGLIGLIFISASLGAISLLFLSIVLYYLMLPVSEDGLSDMDLSIEQAEREREEGLARTTTILPPIRSTNIAPPRASGENRERGSRGDSGEQQEVPDRDAFTSERASAGERREEDIQEEEEEANNAIGENAEGREGRPEERRGTRRGERAYVSLRDNPLYINQRRATSRRELIYLLKFSTVYFVSGLLLSWGMDDDHFMLRCALGLSFLILVTYIFPVWVLMRTVRRDAALQYVVRDLSNNRSYEGPPSPDSPSDCYILMDD